MLEFFVFAHLAAFQAPGASAEELWARGQRAEAIASLRAGLGPEPAAEARARLVAWQIAVHRYQAALADARDCGAPCDALRGEALYHLGEYERAVELLSEREALQVLWKVDALEALSRFAESDAVLGRARELVGADDPRVLGAEGRRLAREGRFGAAAAAFRAAVQVDACDGEALFGLGRALVQGGQREEGLAVLARHRALVPKLDASDAARRGLDLAPAHAPNWTALGDAERALSRFERAESAYRRAAELGAGEALVANALRWARLLAEDRGDVQAAVDLLTRTARLVADARLHVRAGDVLSAAKRPGEAVAAYEKALHLRPGDGEIMQRLATTRAAAGSRRR